VDSETFPTARYNGYEKTSFDIEMVNQISYICQTRFMADYRFHVAISFLHPDETLALELHKQLSKTLKCFIYTEHKKRLAGSDGEKEFNPFSSSYSSDNL